MSYHRLRNKEHSFNFKMNRLRNNFGVFFTHKNKLVLTVTDQSGIWQNPCSKLDIVPKGLLINSVMNDVLSNLIDIAKDDIVKQWEEPLSDKRHIKIMEDIKSIQELVPAWYERAGESVELEKLNDFQSIKDFYFSEIERLSKPENVGSASELIETLCFIELILKQHDIIEPKDDAVEKVFDNLFGKVF